MTDNNELNFNGFLEILTCTDRYLKTLRNDWASPKEVRGCAPAQLSAGCPPLPAAAAARARALRCTEIDPSRYALGRHCSPGHGSCVCR